MKCRICNTDYYYGNQLEPDEPCWCGSMSSSKPVGWDEKFMAFRYYLADKILKFDEKILKMLLKERL
jgi:hypothetical protein